jgi:transcriptional regulator with XRE-family HTH domain
MRKISYKEFIESTKVTFEYDIESAKVDFALELGRLLERNQISKSALADKMGVSAPMVSKILRGDTNLTIETMVKAVRAAQGQLHIHAAAENAVYHWKEIVRSYEVSQLRPERFAPPPTYQPWDIAANYNENESIAA